VGGFSSLRAASAAFSLGAVLCGSATTPRRQAAFFEQVAAPIGARGQQVERPLRLHLRSTSKMTPQVNALSTIVNAA
jgi:hypothetical protein